MKSFRYLFLAGLLSICRMGYSQTIDTLVKVGNYRLHFVILKGKGTVLLFETGAGDDASVWKGILKAVHDSTGATVIAYDRQGFGKSGLDSAHYSIQNEVKGLETALRKLGYHHKLIIAGHSLGGFYATYYANKHARHVRGVVLIDANLSCFFTEEKARLIRQGADLQELKRQGSGVYYILSNIEKTSATMRQTPLPSYIPVLDILAERPGEDGNETDRWKDCHKQFAAASKSRELLLAKGAGHYIFRDKPQLVINAITRFYRAHK